MGGLGIIPRQTECQLGPRLGGHLGLFDEFERRLERVVDGFFSKAFRSPIQPAEVGRRLLREMEGGKTVSVGAVYVPNSYQIHLASEDFDRFEGLVPTLVNEFSGLLRRTAVERRWQFPGPLVVTFEENPRVASGRFEVSAQHDADVVPPPESGPRDALFLLGSQPPEHWVLTGQRMVMGRLAACEIALNDQNASRQHAELARRDDGWWIVDLDSTNGTFVNGSLVKERRLTPGDRIQIGSSRLEFGMEEPEPPAPSAKAPRAVVGKVPSEAHPPTAAPSARDVPLWDPADPADPAESNPSNTD